MRKLLCITFALVWVMSASAQHYFGARGGYGMARGRLRTTAGVAEGRMMPGKFNAGVMWKYYGPQQVVGGVGAELEFMQRGYSIFDARASTIAGGNGIVSDTTSYRVKTRTASSVTLPLIWQPHIYMFNRKVRFYVDLGITFSYNLGMGDTYTVTDYIWNKETRTQTVTSESSPYTMQTARDNRFNYGICGGPGIGVLLGRWEFFAQARYYFGMSDIVRNKSKYTFNDDEMLRSELDNIFVQVGVFFRLGKGGITEPPLRRRPPTPPGDSDFRNIKLPF